MAHRKVMDKDGKMKTIHSSHGDVPHPMAGPEHCAVKPGHGERCAPNGEHAHPEPRGMGQGEGDGKATEDCP